jgi:hypothetical protein
VNLFRILLCSAAFSAAAIVPASAELKSLGPVYLDAASPTAQFRDAFPAPVERLSFKAVHGNLNCDSVRATLTDGSVHQLLTGTVAFGGTDVTPPAGTIQRIDFNCRSSSHMGGVEVLVELGRHEAAWRAHPDWNSKWWYRIAPNEAARPAPQTRS